MRKLTLLLSMFLLITTYVFSQESGKWVIHVGAVIPGADFADDDINNEKALAAALGLGANIEYIYPLNENGLGLFAGLGLNFNWLKSDFKDEIIDELSGYVDEDDITFMKYFTVPVSAGLNYTYKTNDNLSLYGNAGLVANIMKVTNFEVDMGSAGTSVQSFDLSTNLGLKIGGGVILNDKTYFSLNYVNAGKQKIKGEAENDEFNYSTRFNRKHKINYLTLTVGFRL